MSNLPARRDSQSDIWIWEPPESRLRGRGPPWRPVLLIIVALALIGSGVTLMLIADDDDGGDAGAMSSATPARTAAGSTRTAAAPSSSPRGKGPVQLLAWSRDQNRWIANELGAEDAGYREGDSIPFLMRLDSLEEGVLYEVILRYQCGVGDGALFDYLIAPSAADGGALVTEPGPGRARPDTAIPIPDDTSIDFDANGGERFQLWGATFKQSPQGPLPLSGCRDIKELHIALVARAPALYLTWAGHLASARDWGEGRGASAQETPASMEVTVTGLGSAEVQIAAGAVEP